MYSDTMNVKHETYNYTINKCSHQKGNKRFKEKAITGKHSIDSLKKTAILGTSHIMQKALQSET